LGCHHESRRKKQATGDGSDKKIAPLKRRSYARNGMFIWEGSIPIWRKCMLSRADYVSLRETVKGWNARKLASYGIHWPPAHGWRKKLLTEYETGGKGEATIRAHTPKVKQPKWKKLRPDSNQELEDDLHAERRLTADWYDRMTGAINWMEGEKESVRIQMDAISERINALIANNRPLDSNY
jgi:hypothetical protein